MPNATKESRLIFRVSRAGRLELELEAERHNETISETIRRRLGIDDEEEGAGEG